MLIIKLGGSLLGAPELLHWLKLVEKFGDGKVVIVPGGGLFANAVREAQKISNGSDKVAHHLALLAMDQYGLLLADMHPELVTARNELEIAERGWQHRGIIWLPSEMVLADQSVLQNWDVTSDSLSAWLANKLAAQHLILVKSKPLVSYQNEMPSTLQHLVDDEVIDSQFTEFSKAKDFQAWALNKADFTIFEQGFNVHKLAEKALQLNNTTL